MGTLWINIRKVGEKKIIQSLSPKLYHRLVRPRWVTKKYIHDHLTNHFDFQGKKILDFGAGTGANCSLFPPDRYLGVDPDHTRMSYAKKMYPQYSFSVLEKNRIPVENQSIDCILIIAVLHHIPSEEIISYTQEFKRVLKPEGTVIVMEPFLCPDAPLCNHFMRRFDKGKYIRHEHDYLRLFEHNYVCKVIKKFRKIFFYNELFFSARLVHEKVSKP